MPRIRYSEAARSDLARLHRFLAELDEGTADRAIDTIIKGIEYIEAHPTSGQPLQDRPHVRRSVIDFGATGYLVFHKRYEKQGFSFIARIVHQREWYDEESIGLVEEKPVK
jgi:plasmid stabilization system protein ParE